MTTYVPKGYPVPDSDRWYAYKLAQRLGPVEAARVFGISRYTLAAVCAGMPVYAETAARVHRARLEQAKEAA